jgi:acetyl esterase/lipase
MRLTDYYATKTRTGRVLLALTLLLLAGPGAAWASDPAVAITTRPVSEDRYPERRTAWPRNVISMADVTYANPVGFRPLTLDLYRPADVNVAHPLVVFVHGGGWQSGHTRHSGAFENWPAVLAMLTARGYVVSSVEYRLSGEARFPAAIDDVRAAIRWLRGHASEFGIDRSRALIWGGSAGGQLAALAAMDCRPSAPAASAPLDSESSCVQGLIAWYGIFDFASLAAQSSNGPQNPDNADSAPSRYLGCALSKCAPAELAAASPAAFVDSSDPPVLLIHGVGDRTVPIQQSRDFLALLKSKGVAAELIAIPGVDHSFIGADANATRAASEQALDASLAFIDRTIGPGSRKAASH